MPRPGPRPYECVRRAWHSDRHQPLRGSLIHHIFRLAAAAHRPATRRNREWLEKLPLVALRAEEILYSKAASEAEYVDLSTLWRRVNDAIDTIIRRDDGPETDGGLLHPCIEAALNVGCVPRRASRSQRQDDPAYYMSCIQSKISGVPLLDSLRLLQSLPPPPLDSLSLAQLATWCSAMVAAGKFDNHSGGDVGMDSLFPCHGSDLLVPEGSFNCAHSGEVYPNVAPQQSLLETQGAQEDAMDIVPSVCGDETGILHDFIGSANSKCSIDLNSMLVEESTTKSNVECDLSLRLGLSASSSMDTESCWSHEAEGVGSSSSCNGCKRSENPSPGGTRMVNFGSSLSSSKDKGFLDIIFIDSGDEPLESCSSKWSSEGGCKVVCFS